MEKEQKKVVISQQEIIQDQNMLKDTFEEHLNKKQKQNEFLKATDNDPEKWEKNKLQLLKILKEAPITGVYQNQNQQDFQKFFQFYLNFLNAEIGPRGQCAKKIRKQLLQKREIVDQILKPYNQSHKTHIRSIWVHYRFLTPCKEYHSYKILKQTLQKCQESLTKLNTQNSQMYISIKDGLVNKHGQNYDYKGKIQQLKQNYLTKIQKLTKEQIQLKQILYKMQEYIDYVKVGDFMKPYFQEWVQADSGMGKDSVNRGQLFQDKVLKNVLPFIVNCQKYTTLSHIPEEYFSIQNIQDCIQQAKGKANKKHKIPKLHIMTNLRWIPRSLGEIDIAIVQYDQISKQYTAHVLIECKARLFDIRSASEQVYSQNFQNLNKRELSSKYGKVLLSKNLTSYIITSLPDFQFNLPIQSKLKQALDKITKNLPIQTIKQESIKEKLREECLLKFNQVKSPLQWFLENNNNKIIVLSNFKIAVKSQNNYLFNNVKLKNILSLQYDKTQIPQFLRAFNVFAQMEGYIKRLIKDQKVNANKFYFIRLNIKGIEICVSINNKLLLAACQDLGAQALTIVKVNFGFRSSKRHTQKFIQAMMYLVNLNQDKITQKI